MNVALAGLAASGKTCLFNALCEGAVDSAAHPARPDHPNRAAVSVPDERLQWLAELYGAPKQTPVHIVWLDLPGLAPGRADLASQNTAIMEHLRRADALALVLRAFESDRTHTPWTASTPAPTVTSCSANSSWRISTLFSAALKNSKSRSRSRLRTATPIAGN